MTRWVIDAILLMHHSSPTVTVSHARQTRDVDAMLARCWASVVDDGPISNQHWLYVTCLLRVTSHKSVVLLSNVLISIIPSLSIAKRVLNMKNVYHNSDNLNSCRSQFTYYFLSFDV